jgi:rod shape-determining protein MreC
VAFSRRSSRSPRSRFTLGLLLLTAITMLVLDLPGTGPLEPVRDAAATAFRPIRAAGDAVFEPISNGWKGAFGYGDLKDENARLKRDLEERKGQDAKIARLEQQVADLRKLEGIDAGAERTLSAEIISGPISSFEQTVEIDRGSSDGVKVGMAVITGSGVLGRVADVSSDRATVELLTETSVSIGVRLHNGDLAVAHGRGAGKPLGVDDVEDDTVVRKGDYVYTSGIDRTAFPKDLVVGRVSKVGKSVAGIPRVIEVEPLADLTSVYVKVVLREPPS